MAGAIAVLVRNTLRSEFRRINPESARIVLLEHGTAGSRTLFGGPLRGGEGTAREFRCRGPLGHGVDQIDADGVTVAGERIVSQTVIWMPAWLRHPRESGSALKADRAGRGTWCSEMSQCRGIGDLS